MSEPNTSLPGCMMPDGGECCVGYRELYESWKALSSRLDACVEYLKEGETPAECIQRNRDDTTMVLGMLAKDRKALEECTAKLAKVMATPNVSLSTYELLERAAEALCDKLAEIHMDPKYIAVWTLHQIHGGAYDGPQYDAELERLKLALKGKDVERQESKSNVEVNSVCCKCREPTTPMDAAAWKDGAGWICKKCFYGTSGVIRRMNRFSTWQTR